MVFTDAELSYLRLLDRTKKLMKEDISRNVWKVSAAALQLENFLSAMQDEKGLDCDLFLQYSKELQQLKLLVEAHHKKNCEDKLAALDSLPHGFPQIARFDALLPDKQGKCEERNTGETSSLRMRNKAVYQADMRRQLLGEKEKAQEDLSSEKEHELAEELLQLATNLKRNIKYTGDVLKEDNQRLMTMQEKADFNREKLNVEGTRLAKNAYSCGFDCFLIFLAIFVFWSFIAMVLLIKFFPKSRG